MRPILYRRFSNSEWHYTLGAYVIRKYYWPKVGDVSTACWAISSRPQQSISPSFSLIHSIHPSLGTRAPRYIACIRHAENAPRLPVWIANPDLMRFPVVKLMEHGCECWNMMVSGSDDCIRDLRLDDYIRTWAYMHMYLYRVASLALPALLRVLSFRVCYCIGQIHKDSTYMHTLACTETHITSNKPMER